MLDECSQPWYVIDKNVEEITMCSLKLLNYQLNNLEFNAMFVFFCKRRFLLYIFLNKVTQNLICSFC